MSADNPRRCASSLIADTRRSATAGSAPAPDTGLVIATIDNAFSFFFERSRRKNLSIVASHHHVRRMHEKSRGTHHAPRRFHRGERHGGVLRVDQRVSRTTKRG